jgi:hypothetical protein
MAAPAAQQPEIKEMKKARIRKGRKRKREQKNKDILNDAGAMECTCRMMSGRVAI